MSNILNVVIKFFIFSLLTASGANVNANTDTDTQADTFSFGVIANVNVFKTVPDDSILREAIAATNDDNLAFVVANGIKASNEACNDAIYMQRKTLFDSAKNGLIVSLTANDWSECKNAQGKSAAVGKLNRVRELFFDDEFSFGNRRIPIVRQSSNAKFRSYAENARWEISNNNNNNNKAGNILILFATINLPANNNHYRLEAGRNSEFEDRLIANRDWLQRLFRLASLKKANGIVLFCDADPLAAPSFLQSLSPNAKRDGFAEIRKYIHMLSAKYAGKVLIVHNYIGDQHASDKSPPADEIVWHNNTGNLGIASEWLKVTVHVSGPGLFTVQH